VMGCGASEVSLLQETLLVQVVAATVGTNLKAARIALEEARYDTTPSRPSLLFTDSG
jgi:hypothetical protein